MSTFSRRKLEGSKLLGERLRELREEEGITLEQLAASLVISAKHLKALEAGDYASLPGDVYVKNFLRKIAPALHVDTQRVLTWYERERSIVAGTREGGMGEVIPPQAVREGFSLSPRIVRIVLFSIATLAVAAYLVWQLQQVFQAPELLVSSPQNNITTTERSILVEGKSEPEAEVRVNDQEIPVDREGVFRERVNLREGLNTIRITAKRGRSTTAVDQRLVFVEEALAP
ncbi:MAG: helix-turn-helix domain-containing protein [Patescibacteria group bacterium]|jgi:cytoskeletal protein RodZ